MEASVTCATGEASGSIYELLPYLHLPLVMSGLRSEIARCRVSRCQRVTGWFTAKDGGGDRDGAAGVGNDLLNIRRYQ